MNRDKLKKVLSAFSNSDAGVKEAFKSIEKEMQRVADKLREEAETKTVNLAKQKIKELKEQIKSIFEALDVLKEDLKKSEGELVNGLNQKIDILKTRMVEYRTASLERLGMLSAEIDGLKKDIREISQRKIEIPNYEVQIKDLEVKLKEVLVDLTGDKEEMVNNFQKSITDLDKEIKKLRRDTMSIMANRGGGNMNRNILVGDNSSTLGRYTDLNIKAGTNVTLTYINNDNLKTTDLTIAAAGGSGSPGGSDTQVQFNDGGSFGGDAGMTYNKTTSILTLVKIELGHASDTTLARVSAGVISIEGVTIATSSNTLTLTNKRITKRVVTASDDTSITPNTDNADITYQSNSQATGTLTINADSGTPTSGQSWLLKIKSTNVQTFSWNAVFAGGTLALPTSSTGGGKIDYYAFIYDTVNSKWHFTGQALNL